MKRRNFILVLIGFILLVVSSGIYWSTNLPGIEVVDGEVRVVNCQQPMPKYARGVCPKLYCKKAVMESELFQDNAQIGFEKTKKKDDAPEHVVGAVRYLQQDSAPTIKRFQCEMEGYRVVQVLLPE